MSTLRAFIKAAVAVASVTFFTIPAFGQSPAAEDPKPKNLQSEIEALKTENAAVRELLRTMAEQQKALLEQVSRLQRRLDGSAPADASIAVQPAAVAAPPAAVHPASGVPPEANKERYRDGIVIWETPETAKVPFLLKFNINTQLRYLNTQNSDESFTDHLGADHEVHTRNDLTVNRAMFILGGYIFNPRARYSFTVWTSAGAASIVVASNIGWQFNKAFTLTGGYTGVPGSRSLVNTFPFFTATDRSMADNFFRPGFTQGVWASGEPVKGLNYLTFVGNGLNTLSISANKIDTHLLFSSSAVVGAAGPLRRAWQGTQHVRRLFRLQEGSHSTLARHLHDPERTVFSNLDQSSPQPPQHRLAPDRTSRISMKRSARSGRN